MENYKEETILLCEDSTEGILSAVYDAYHYRLDHYNTYVETKRGGENYRLFAQYKKVETDARKVRAVLQTLRKEFDEEDILWLDYALAAQDTQRGQAVYRTIVEGRYQRHEGRQRRGLFDDLKNPEVHKAFVLARGTSNEVHHLKGFLRFEETKNQILYAKLGPQNNVLPFLSGHFADRFPRENFVIHDVKRNLFSVHPAAGEWYLVQGDKENNQEKQFQSSEAEGDYQALFRSFCQSIAIKERKNERLQANLLPLHFREYMTEFQDSVRDI